jgi:hypothetical protein
LRRGPDELDRGAFVQRESKPSEESAMPYRKVEDLPEKQVDQYNPHQK